MYIIMTQIFYSKMNKVVNGKKQNIYLYKISCSYKKKRKNIFNHFKWCATSNVKMGMF